MNNKTIFVILVTLCMTAFSVNATAAPVDSGGGDSSSCSDGTTICYDSSDENGGDGASGATYSDLCGKDELLTGSVYRSNACWNKGAVGRPPVCIGTITEYYHYQCRRSNGTYYPAAPGGTAIRTTKDTFVSCDVPRC